jgi:DsbC/DsbD-like thiol-disulfide interchange protein
MQYRLIFAWICGWMALAAGCSKPATTSIPNMPALVVQAGKPDHSPDNARVPILTEEPTLQNPFVARAALGPSKGHPGDRIVLVIEGKTAPGWHIYAADDSKGTGMPTSLVLKLPEGVALEGEWEFPRAKAGQEGERGTYEGLFQFRQALRFTEGAKPGPIEVQCELAYEACDPFHCLPPKTMTLAAGGEVVLSP